MDGQAGPPPPAPARNPCRRRCERHVPEPPPARRVHTPRLVHRLVEGQQMRLRPGAADDALRLRHEKRQGQRVDGAGGVEADGDAGPVGLPRAPRLEGGFGRPPPAPRPSWRPRRRPVCGATRGAGRSARGPVYRATRPPTPSPPGPCRRGSRPAARPPCPALRPASSARRSWLRQSAVFCRSPVSSGSPRLRSCAKPRVTPQSRAFSARRVRRNGAAWPDGRRPSRPAPPPGISRGGRSPPAGRSASRRGAAGRDRPEAAFR
jgi:hypothetical protein